MSIRNTENQAAGAYACISGSAAASPDLVIIRGKTTQTNQVAHIDWLAFTVHPVLNQDWHWLRFTLADIFNIPKKAWKGTNKKWSGYQHRVDLILPLDRGESINLGLVGYGGESQKGTMHVSLNAQACARITDWSLVNEWSEITNAAITRVDVAHDDFEGQTINIDIVRKWYEDGLFNFNGRPPTAQLIDDLGSGKGKTFSVGKRGNAKYVRCYEKGKKEGDPNSPWFRAELELHNNHILIPWDIVINPGHYLAGAYPCFAYLSIKQEKIKSIQRAGKINYEHMVKWLRSAAGKGLNAMLQVEDGDIGAVFEQIVRDGLPKRLEPFAKLTDVINRDEHEDVKP